jgi:hypothetical protein
MLYRPSSRRFVPASRCDPTLAGFWPWVKAAAGRVAGWPRKLAIRLTQEDGQAALLAFSEARDGYPLTLSRNAIRDFRWPGKQSANGANGHPSNKAMQVRANPVEPGLDEPATQILCAPSSSSAAGPGQAQPAAAGAGYAATSIASWILAIAAGSRLSRDASVFR